MADDDDISRLLREVDSLTSGKPPADATSGGKVDKRTGDEVATTGGAKTTEHLMIAASAGAIITFFFFLIPFIGSFGLLSRVLAGAIGGATGYLVARYLLRDKDE